MQLVNNTPEPVDAHIEEVRRGGTSGCTPVPADGQSYYGISHASNVSFYAADSDCEGEPIKTTPPSVVAENDGCTVTLNTSSPDIYTIHLEC